MNHQEVPTSEEVWTNTSPPSGTKIGMFQMDDDPYLTPTFVSEGEAVASHGQKETHSPVAGSGNTKQFIPVASQHTRSDRLSYENMMPYTTNTALPPPIPRKTRQREAELVLDTNFDNRCTNDDDDDGDDYEDVDDDVEYDAVLPEDDKVYEFIGSKESPKLTTQISSHVDSNAHNEFKREKRK